MSESFQRFQFIVAKKDKGRRIDQVLADNVPELSRRRARALLDIGGVFVDGARVKVAGRAVWPGQEVVANVGAALQRATKEVGSAARERDEASLPPYQIVHQDADIVVVEKPAGLLTAPTPESDRSNLADQLRRKLGGDEIYVVHRLDLGTSGLLVFARTAAANRTLSERFQVHDIERAYFTVLRGSVVEDEQTVSEPVAGKRAVTHFSVVERIGDLATLARCRLETGRTHQIRLHSRHLGHTVLGDTRHGERTEIDPPRMALHATLLGFVHPRTGEKLSFESPFPQELADWLARLRARIQPQ